MFGIKNQGSHVNQSVTETGKVLDVGQVEAKHESQKLFGRCWGQNSILQEKNPRDNSNDVLSTWAFGNFCFIQSPSMNRHLGCQVDTLKMHLGRSSGAAGWEAGQTWNMRKAAELLYLLQKLEVTPLSSCEVPFLFSILSVKNGSILPPAPILHITLQVLLQIVTSVIINPDPLLST